MAKYTLEDIEKAITQHKSKADAFVAIANSAGVKPGSVAVRYYRSMSPVTLDKPKRKSKVAKAAKAPKAKRTYKRRAVKAVKVKAVRAPRALVLTKHVPKRHDLIRQAIIDIYSVPESLVQSLLDSK